ncbi:hypothetical protein LTR53_014818 [Teratosphaeriaceae sp. CCFEE 6253]|nr:hypothetical protein LTR53_014818 [Teratosphaeriaceae sp. CCFEE 6253]
MSLPFRQLNFAGSSPSTPPPLSMPSLPISPGSALSEPEDYMPAVAAPGMAEFTARQPSIDSVESSGPQIISIMDHRPADQYDWTTHDLESLRRDREEAEQVRDLHYTINGVNMSGDENGTTDNYVLPDAGELLAQQATAYRDMDDDVALFQVKIYQMHEWDNASYIICCLCQASHPQGFHPVNGCLGSLRNTQPPVDGLSESMSTSSDGGSNPG